MKILIILSLFISQTLYSQCLKADIVLLLDWSSSEDRNGHYITEASTDFIQSLDLGPSSIKIGIIPFEWIPVSNFCVPPSSNSDVLINVINKLDQTSPSGMTSYYDAFYLANDFFKISEIERGEVVLKIVVLISDGEEYGFDSDDVITKVKNNGSLIWSIGTSDRMSIVGRNRMMSVCSGPEFYSEQTYFTLREELLKLNLCP